MMVLTLRNKEKRLFHGIVSLSAHETIFFLFFLKKKSILNYFDGEIVRLKWRERTFEGAERSPFHNKILVF